MDCQPTFVVLSAGAPHYGDSPSSLKSADDYNVLDWQLRSVSRLCSSSVVVIGYHSSDYTLTSSRYLAYIENKKWQETSSSFSALLALEDLSGSALVSYGDVLFRPNIAEQLTGSSSDICIAGAPSCSKKSNLPKPEAFYSHTAPHVSKIGVDLPQTPNSYNFLGIVYFSDNVVEFINSNISALRAHLFKAPLPKLIDILRANGFEASFIDSAADCAEVVDSSDIARFFFGTKAETLERLKDSGINAALPMQYILNKSKWLYSQAEVLSDISHLFGTLSLAIRSSSKAEDTLETSNAGCFDSFLNVRGDNHIIKAVEDVFNSYPPEDNDDDTHLLVQNVVEDVICSGVVMTRTLDYHAPWYVINFENGSDTASITSGSSVASETLYIYKNSLTTSEYLNILPWQKNLLSRIQSIETLLGYDSLDIEFAVNNNNEVYILQVRPIATKPFQRYSRSYENGFIDKSISMAKSKFLECGANSINAESDDLNVFGCMPDWNPAEIIGTAPSNLSVSLYKYLVTDEIWAQQRSEFGYYDMRPSKLLYLFCGKPYIDVRASLTSFIPKSIDKDLCKRFVDFNLNFLVNNPSFHDKVEFEVTPTCFSPSINKWRNRYLEDEDFTPSEVDKLFNSLRILTHQSFSDISRYSEPLNSLLSEHHDILNHTSMSKYEKLSRLLYICRNNGTLPFAHLARCGFIAITLLKEAIDQNVITAEAFDAFMSSLNTVSNQMLHDSKNVALGTHSFELFSEKYGHLRPGTYDINSPRYDSNPDFFMKPLCANRSALDDTDSASNVSLWDNEGVNLANHLGSIGLEVSFDQLNFYLRAAIEGRENAKFLFTRVLSDSLELIADIGADFNLSREECSYLALDYFFRDDNYLNSFSSDEISAIIERNRERQYFAKQIPLPVLLTSKTSFDMYTECLSKPNFIGNTSVTANLILITPEILNSALIYTGKIVLIPQADPGYDWLFGCQIKGLITLYGGSNSHMAIRSSELGIAAAIGVGTTIYENLQKANAVYLDPTQQTIKIIR